MMLSWVVIPWCLFVLLSAISSAQFQALNITRVYSPHTPGENGHFFL